MGNCCGKREVIVLNAQKKPQIRRRRSSIFRENITKQTDYKKKYDYISLIGNGGFGKVRLFRDRNFKNLKYAIKTIKKDLLNTHGIQCIIDEVKILRSVDHPNIVKYFESYEEDHMIHIVMEYIPGQNLFELLTGRKHKKRFSEQEICQLVTSILKAIVFLHRSKIIHRDLKPENILVSNPEDLTSLKIIDFGLSVLGKKDEKYRVGSPYYMAPEMIEGNYSKASDMWSIGVILYLILTGRQPFEGVDQHDVYRKILKGIYDRKVLKDDKFSPEIRDFVEKLLVVKESQRMGSEQAFEHPWISKFSSNSSTAIINESIIESLRSFSKNNILQKEILFYLAKISNESEIVELKKAFDGLDINNTGVIEFGEVENIFKRLNITATADEIKEIWEGMDFHNDGKVNYTEFLAATLSTIKHLKEEKLLAAFKYFDQDDCGYITAHSLIDALKNDDIPIDELGLYTFFEKYYNVDKKLNFEEFKILFSKN